MPTVTNTLKRPDGTAATDGVVLIQLVGANNRPVVGYVTASDYAIHGTYRPAVNSSTAVWSATLVANSLINPSGTVYKVTENVDGVANVDYISVPDGAGPYVVEDILADPPAAIDAGASVAINAHLVDTAAAHAASAVAFTPAGSVAATTVQAAIAELDAEKVGYTTEVVTGGFPAASVNEYLVKLDAAGANVLALQNDAANGTSAITMRGDDGREYLAMGYGNSETEVFLGHTYIQAWSGKSTAGAPPVFAFFHDGNYGSVGSGFRNYRRLTFGTDGKFNIWNLTPYDGSTQVSLFEIPNAAAFRMDPSAAASDALILRNRSADGSSSIAHHSDGGVNKYSHGYANANHSISNVRSKAYMMLYNNGGAVHDYVIGHYVSAWADKWTFKVAGELEIHTVGKGLVMASPDGTRYAVTVANGGTINVAAA